MPEPQSILVVDDDAEMLKALTHTLQTAGYRVTGQPDATSALALLQTGQHQFDLVISDVSMPGLKGLPFLTALKTAFPALPVIIITAFGDWGQYQQALREGAYEFLSKPVDQAELLECVRRALSDPAPAQPTTPPWDRH